MKPASKCAVTPGYQAPSVSIFIIFVVLTIHHSYEVEEYTVWPPSGHGSTVTVAVSHEALQTQEKFNATDSLFPHKPAEAYTDL